MASATLQFVLVWAVEGRSLPLPGGPLNGARFVARDRRGESLPEGQLVPLDSYHHRAIERGDLSTTDPRGATAREE